METGKKKKKKIWLIVLIVVIAAAVIAGIAIHKLTGEVEVVANIIEVEPVQARDLSDYISLNGTVSGASRTNVMSKASAEVLGVNVQVGDEVKAGDELVSLDTAELERQIAELEKQIRNADALAKNETSLKNKSLAEAKEDQDIAVGRASGALTEAQLQAEELRNQSISLMYLIENKNAELMAAAEQVSALEPQKDESEEQLKAYEEAVSAYTEISEQLSELKQQKAECEQALSSAYSGVSAARDSYDETVRSTGRAVSAAQNTVDMAKYQTDGTSELSAQLDLMKEQLADCILQAPCQGVVTAVNISVGDQYAAGQTMVTIEDTSALKVAVEVKEEDILRIAEGMKAILKTTATGEEELSGTVTRVVRVKSQSMSPNAMGEGAQTGYSAEITVDQADLLVGMSATAKIILQEKKNTLAIPYDLIRYDENENTYVLVAEAVGDGQARAVRKDVALGGEFDYYVEITGGDLQAGDLLIHDYTGEIMEGSTFLPEQLYEEQRLEDAGDSEDEAGTGNGVEGNVDE